MQAAHTARLWAAFYAFAGPYSLVLHACMVFRPLLAMRSGRMSGFMQAASCRARQRELRALILPVIRAFVRRVGAGCDRCLVA